MILCMNSKNPYLRHPIIYLSMISSSLLLLFLLPTICLSDAPEPWGLGFQDGASPSFEGITELHDSIMFYLIIILLGVGWLLSSVVLRWNVQTNPIVHKYHNHGTLIELVWTITPAVVLIAIAFPSFKLLYLLDVFINPTIWDCFINKSIYHYDSVSIIYMFCVTSLTLNSKPSNNRNENAELNKVQILNETRGKSGVYKWTNSINGK